MLKAPIEAIIATLEYGNRYGIVYSKNDIAYRLISANIYSEDSIWKTIKKYKLRVGGIKNRCVDNKMRLAKSLAIDLAKHFADILLIGVTGSVAAEYPNNTDDIDIMIVTKKDKLWLTRLKLRLYVFLNKIPHRRYGHKERKDEFCFNLWLDEEALILPKSKRNLKNAMDLVLIKPLINKNLIYERLVSVNRWAKKYVANGYSRINATKIIKGKKFEHSSIFDKIINWLIFWPQYWYMKTKIGGGLIDTKRAFFHPNSN